MRPTALLCLVSIAAVSVDACCKNKEIGKCCGNGKCNIFCCNCDGGCNQLCETDYGAFLNTGLAVVGTAAAFGRKKRNVQNLTARIVRSAERFASVDADKNGAVTLQEAIDYLNLHNVARRDVKGATPSWFTKMDANRDGLISPAEFDFSLAH